MGYLEYRIAKLNEHAQSMFRTKKNKSKHAMQVRSESPKS